MNIKKYCSEGGQKYKTNLPKVAMNIKKYCSEGGQEYKINILKVVNNIKLTFRRWPGI